MDNETPSRVTRVIKKYPNRRLYDTRSARYITLEGVRETLNSGESIKVIDSKSEADLTHSVLLQIISELESNSATPMISEKTLEQLIVFHGDSMQGLLREYLERSVDRFMSHQSGLRDQLHQVADTLPATDSEKATEEA